MFSQLKNFLSKTLTRRPSEPAAPEKSAAPAKPAAAPPAKTSGGTAFKFKSKPSPTAPPPAPAPVSASAPVAVASMAEPVSTSPDDLLNLPVKVILNRLPAALSALVKSPGENGSVGIPMQRVLKQLPQGAVKLTFGELRQLAPAGTFLEVATQDQTLVELPLPEIISRLSPAHLQRRAPQRQLDAPAEVANIFGPRGEPLPQPQSETAMYRKSGGTTITSRTGGTSFTTKTSVPPAKPTVPPGPAPAATVPAPSLPPPPAPALPKPAIPAPPTPPLPAAPRVPAPSLPKPPVPAPKTEAPKISMPSVPPPPAPAVPAPTAPAPVPVAAAAAPTPEQTRYFLEKEAAPTSEALTVALASISESWPESIKKEIAELKLGDSSVGLPMNKIEAALKTGKIVFTWGDIGSWIRPEPVSNSANAATVLDLPLKVVAPLFISQHRPVAPQKKLAIAENIPDIFSGSPLGKAAAAPATPTMPPPAPVMPPAAPVPTLPTPAPTPAAPIAPAGLPKIPTPSMPAAPAPSVPVKPIVPSGLPKPPAPPAAPLPPPPAPAPSLPKMAPPTPVAPVSIPKPPAAPAIPVAPSLPKPPVAAPIAPAPMPAPLPPLPAAPAPAVAAPVAKEPQTLGELFGDAAKKEWSPKEIVQNTNKLKGVAGSMISLPDGLMVAGELPSPFRAETTAAFLPQIFGRMNQYCKELHLGEMNGITVECQKAPLQIIRTGLVFFGVLGRAGEPLPASQIRLIAEELARQNK